MVSMVRMWKYHDVPSDRLQDELLCNVVSMIVSGTVVGFMSQTMEYPPIPLLASDAPLHMTSMVGMLDQFITWWDVELRTDGFNGAPISIINGPRWTVFGFQFPALSTVRMWK